MPKTREKKRWFTVAYLTREGAPHPAHRASNFSQSYKTARVLLEDLSYAMSHELGHRGAYVAGAWPGQISENEALRGPTKPLYYVFEGGRVEKVS